MVRLTDRLDMTLDVYRGRKTTIQLQLYKSIFIMGGLGAQPQGAEITYIFTG